MKKEARQSCALLVICSALLFSGCDFPMTKYKQAYLGTWKGDSILLTINPNGIADYRKNEGSESTHIKAIIRDFGGQNLSLGPSSTKLKLKIQQAPEEIGGIWTMVVENEELIKFDPKTEVLLARLGQSAIHTAEAFLQSMDRGDYVGAWELTEPLLKAAYSQERWRSLLINARASLGTVFFRKLIAMRYTRRIENAPKAQFIVLAYDTFFSSNRHTLEKLTLQLDSNGQWVNSGYAVGQSVSDYNLPQPVLEANNGRETVAQRLDTQAWLPENDAAVDGILTRSPHQPL
jgi:hypothetical protein